jgi:uncharacterized protein (DUF362 family)/ferredoxin
LYLAENGNRVIVAVVKCSSYDQGEVDGALQRGIDFVGGVNRFATSGERILFKPNVLWGTDPAKCVVTHPAVLRGAVTVFSGSGATLEYGDSSAGLPRKTQALEKCGYGRVLKSLPVKAVSFDRGQEVTFQEGIAGKRLRIAATVLDSDGIINLPKLKTHGLTRMTGAVKNLFGCVPGMTKGEYHARFPDVYNFSKLLADITALIQPRLHIMDAIEAMEGNGPQSGTPKNLGILLFSTDPVALDAVACRLINLDPDCVPTIAAGENAGCGVGDLHAVDIVGDALEPCVDHSFRVVREPPASLPGTGLLGMIKRFFLPRPAIVASACVCCGRCVSMCPVSPPALTQNDNLEIPRYDYSKCIRCYCCQEVCPKKAIVIRKSVLGMLLPYVPYISLLVTRIRARRGS